MKDCGIKIPEIIDLLQQLETKDIAVGSSNTIYLVSSVSTLAIHNRCFCPNEIQKTKLYLIM